MPVHHELVHQVGADKARATGHEDSLPVLVGSKNIRNTISGTGTLFTATLRQQARLMFSTVLRTDQDPNFFAGSDQIVPLRI